MSITPFPASPKTLAKARKYVENKRADIGCDQENRSAMVGAMLESLGQALGEMGVSGLQIGNQHIALAPPQRRSAAVEEGWIQRLNEGKFVVAIEAGMVAARMFLGDEKVRMEHRRIEDLVDLDRIRALAPDAVVYGPGEVAPWPNLISHAAFSIWVDDRAQFDALWAGWKAWMKTEWFDATMQQCQQRWRASDMFDMMATYNIAPDLAWREAQYMRAQQVDEQAREAGGWDARAQQEIKKTIGSLLQVEGHPLLGPQVAPLVDALTPMLAFAMDGKDRARKIAEAHWAARNHCFQGFEKVQVSWKDHAPQSPLPATIPPRVGKPRRR